MCIHCVFKEIMQSFVFAQLQKSKKKNMASMSCQNHTTKQNDLSY